MASYNKIIMVGNLTRDPQLSYLPSETPVCEIGLATNRRWKSSDGQQREEVCFIDCRAFGKQAEAINQYLSKGRLVLIEGRLSFDQWESADGQKRSKHRITIESFQFMDSKGDGERPARQEQSQASRPPASQPPASRQDDDQPDGPNFEDIPF